MLYKEIIAVCSQIHTKHINTLCGLNAEFVKFKSNAPYSTYCAVHCLNAMHHTVLTVLYTV